MSAFDEREKAFEAKYHLDEELAFKVNARRAKLLGLWVAELLGLNAEQAQAYAKATVEADLSGGQGGAVKKALSDLATKGVEITESKVLHQAERLLATARAEIVSEVSDGKQTVTPE